MLTSILNPPPPSKEPHADIPSNIQSQSDSEITSQLIRENQELRKTIDLLQEKLALQTSTGTKSYALNNASVAQHVQSASNWDAMIWLLSHHTIKRHSNTSRALLALACAIAQARQINEHILGRWNTASQLQVHHFKLPLAEKDSSLDIVEKAKSITASICHAAVSLRKSNLRGRLMVRSHHLSSFRRFAKSADNAYVKTKAKLAAKMEVPPIWPPSTPVFPSDECKTNTENELKSNLQLFLKQNKNIIFPKHPEPVLSVIVCVYNKPEFLLRTLDALKKNSDVPCEVIIWDDCSTCDMEPLYSRIQGANIIRSSKNLNFVLANNEAAKYAKGEFLLLLNSDAAIRRQALSSSLSTFLEHPKIGIVGGCLILPDGNVQEAGNVIWRDGSCASIGRGLSPDDMRLHSYRQVHYCSGAFMMTRTKLWREMGGFDPDFAPAYYEETDFCIRAARGGWLTIYNPGAKIDHYEFATNGRHAAVALMQQNRNRLLTNNEAILSQHPQPLDWHGFFLGSSHVDRRKKLLFLDDQFPTQTAGAGFPRAACLLQHLAKGSPYEVWFVATHHSSANRQDEPEAGLKWIHSTSFNSRESLIRFLQQEFANFDAVFVSRPHNKMLLDEACTGMPSSQKPFIIYDAEAIFAERDITQHRLMQQTELPKEVQGQMLGAEIRLASNADLITTVSELDSDKFKKLLPDKSVHHLDYIAREYTVDATSFHDRNGLLFVGPLLAENTPNADGFYWLMEKVSSHFTTSFAPVQMTHVGKSLLTGICSTAAISLHLRGPVETLVPYFATARVFVCPIRFAAGTSAKAIDALAAGLPMVCTPIIAQQLGLEHEKHALVADSAEAFAQCIERLYRDAQLWETISKNGREYILNTHSAEVFKHNFQRMLDHVCAKMESTKI